MHALDRLAQSLAGSLAFCGIGVAVGEDRSFHLSAPERKVTPATMFRVASVSKIVTAQVFRATAGDAGLTAPHAVDMGDLLGLPLRHPAAPEVPVTPAMVASHSAGLTDAAGYAVPPGVPLAEWLAAQGPAIWGKGPPGARFDYCNLGYILLAAAAEALAGERFDVLAGHWLRRHRIAGGFNWSGVAPSRRADRLPTFRRDGTGAFRAQIDTEVPPEGLVWNDGGVIPTDALPPRPGTSRAQQFSPQGGLRTSLAGMLAIAGTLDVAGPRLWSPAMGPVEGPSGVFESYGWGVQIFDKPAFYPRPLMGHFANAYGFVGGTWVDPARNARFAYALNGLPEGDEDDAFRPEELAIFAAVAESLG